ncbi:hypothetical protein GGS23DRAFT_596655 [Durotheca rogersii]|uniref:uncharacterized protein n=1 Tax=Durotheca rogersii TaxID=419775 RepID=UPI0022205A70|nr:uncharacterized protein GGS23DRAFT_596655 [Durotheca rogersii]KAI5863479.1 hypothetical protein GGS23DRAFT_596655 [Durotheca rogersii]
MGDAVEHEGFNDPSLWLVQDFRKETRERNPNLHLKMSGQFGFMGKIGATDEAVAVLNDQPYIFTILVVVLVILILQITFHWYIHHATLKPEQIKKKEPKGAKKKPAAPASGAKPPAAR